MSRRRQAVKRKVLPDPVYNDELVSRFINKMMIHGKRAAAEKQFYNAIEMLEKSSKDKKGIESFKEAIDNVKPLLEVKSRRVGGSNYQVPIEVRSDRRQALAIRWIIEFARGRAGKSMAERLAGELGDASTGRGGAIKRREDVHKMADANKAFAHFRW